jgi:hypothetical protein
LTVEETGPVLVGYRFVIDRIEHGFEQAANGRNLARRQTVYQSIHEPAAFRVRCRLACEIGDLVYSIAEVYRERDRS